MDMMRFDDKSSFLQRAIDHFDLSDVHIVAPDVAMPVALHYALHREHRAAKVCSSEMVQSGCSHLATGA